MISVYHDNLNGDWFIISLKENSISFIWIGSEYDSKNLVTKLNVIWIPAGIFDTTTSLYECDMPEYN